ncbi:hypothetical protein GIB67_038434 [Kingdonia uniflora]|uniref:Uncharacterized protein n=1 Tax=Kingdonia uniflora TaxID=39325 RepID=A0A7J7NNZ2_9MAGN|nr:hypothetical protein GIB67_038434 [Kingdonia uniflora]
MVETTVRETMEKANKIAHEIGGIQNDALRFGLHGVKTDIVGDHPLQSVIPLSLSLYVCFEFQIELVLTVFYYCMNESDDADRSRVEYCVRRQFRISFLFEDGFGYTNQCQHQKNYNWLLIHLFLSLPFADPSESETYRSSDMHHGMEVWRGMSKGPICPSFI